MEEKEDYEKMGESKAGIDYRTVKIMCFLEGGHTLERGSEREHFRGVFNLDAGRQWTRHA